MKVYRKESRKYNNSKSIKKSGSKYTFSSNGRYVAEIVVDETEFFELKMGINVDQMLSSNGFDPEDHYIDTPDNIHSVMPRASYNISIYKRVNVNEIGFGVFECFTSMSYGTYLKDYEHKDVTNTLIDNHDLKGQILNFFNKPVTNDRKHKKGFLLFGRPGNGKSTSLMQLFPIAKELEIRIITLNRKVDLSDLNDFRDMLGKDKTIFILEELTQRTNSEGTEELLTFLDGENSWDNCVIVATTNYPKDLPANLVDRPGRFDTFIEYKDPTNEDIVALGAKFGFDEKDSLVLASKELSFDYVSFIMSQAKSNDMSVKEALEIEVASKAQIAKTFKSKMGMGI